MGASNLETYNLGIAEAYVSTKPIVVRTVLGSCISVCLWDRRKFYGGMAHIVLPHTDGNRNSFGRADILIPHLLTTMMSYGSKTSDLYAVISGGGQKLSHVFNIGEKNIQYSKRLLKSYGISVMQKDVGGNVYRTVYFNTLNGNVLVERINNPPPVPTNKTVVA